MSDILTIAAESARTIPRRWVNWMSWWSGDEPNKHRLYLGTSGTAWDACCHHQVCDLRLRPFPELSLLRPYLKAIASHQRETRVVDHPFLLERKPPLYFGGVYGGSLAYVDLNRAYWSIYTRATLDVAYDGENRPKNGTVHFLDADELGERKLLRNAILGSLRRKRRRGVDHGEPFIEEIPDTERRPNLWGLVMDVIELVAWDMRSLGAVYVHTDGYIFGHRDLAHDAVEMVSDKYGLEASIRAEGEGYVSGIGRWRIGTIAHGSFAKNVNRVDSMLPPTPRLARDLTDWCKYAR